MRKVKMTQLSLCFLFLISLCFPTSTEANANDYIVVLTETKGEVFFTKGGGKKEFIAEDGAALTQGDRVRTGLNSSVTLVFNNESEIVLGAQSRIVISELAHHSTAIKLASGELWNKVVGLSSTEDRFNIETPASVIVVRGTLFHVDVDVESSMLRVIDGNVEVTLHETTEVIKVGGFEQLKMSLSDSAIDVGQLDIDSFIKLADTNILAQIIQDLLQLKGLQIEKMIQSITESLEQSYPTVENQPSGGSGNRTPNPDPDPITEPEVTSTWLETNDDGTQLYVKVEGFPSDKPIVALQIHLAFAGGSNIDIEALVSSGMTVTSNLLGTANSESQAQLVKGFNSNGIQRAELMVAQTFFGQALTSGYVIIGNETISVDLSSVKLNHTGPFEIQIIDAMFLDQDGQPIDIEINQSIMEIN